MLLAKLIEFGFSLLPGVGGLFEIRPKLEEIKEIIDRIRDPARHHLEVFRLVEEYITNYSAALQHSVTMTNQVFSEAIKQYDAFI
jgi:hypothetical protein